MKKLERDDFINVTATYKYIGKIHRATILFQCLPLNREFIKIHTLYRSNAEINAFLLIRPRDARLSN